MTQKILVAIDDSENAGRTVAFVSQTLNHHNTITLFSVLPDTASLCDMNSPELSPLFKSEQSSFCLLEEEKRKLMGEALEKSKSFLVEAGFDAKSVEIKIGAKKAGIARDIVNEARVGYDMIVIGRRGTSRIKDYFLGSISHKVLHLAEETPVLIVS
jgi:nucleotide-binding universal stress UspA family protein